MSELEIWFVYLAITVILAIIAFTIPETSKGILMGIKYIASISLALIGITFIVFTLALGLEYIIPNQSGNSGSSSASDEDQCVPDPWGGC